MYRRRSDSNPLTQGGHFGGGRARAKKPLENQQLISPSIEWKWVVAILGVAAVGLVDPVGFGGGGADDGRYLAAAQCWQMHGPCLPTNHWEGRWPVVAPLALALTVFGLNEVAAAIPSLLASAVSLLLLVRLGNRLFASPVGYIAAAVMAATPTFLIEATHPAVEPIELMFILSAGLLALDRRPLLAGLALGLAFQARETAIAALLPFVWTMRRDIHSLVRFGCGFILPLAIELVIFAIWVGDPLWRHRLSIAHTRIVSSELPQYDGKPPFFNRSLLENWRYEPGLRLHWLVDGFLNLFVNAKTSLLFLITPVLLAFYRPPGRRCIAFLVGCAFVYAAILIYVLCVDPKPRMFIPALALLALAFAPIAYRCRSPIIGAIIVAVLPLSLLTLEAQPRMRHWRATASEWVELLPDQVSTPYPKYFTFSPELMALPTGGRPYSLVFEQHGCRIPVARKEPSNRIAVLFGDRQAICLYRVSGRSAAGR